MRKFIYVLCFMLANMAFSKVNDTFNTPYTRQFKETLPNKYTNKSFNYEEKIITENDLTISEQIKQWLAEFFQRLFSVNDGFSFAGSFLNFMAFLIVLIVVYFIAKALINKEGFWLFSKSSNKLVGQTTIEENINEINFSDAIKSAKKQGQHRQVIRLYYLWLLKAFTEKGYIIWDKDKTNADYLNEIENQQIKTEFAYLSYLYNYTWYGFFDISEEDFIKMNESFERTLKSIGS